jgi:hypothetical protein
VRYRALDANGDYSGGRGQGNFLINSAACVAQSVLTRLKLWQGEWFLDVTDGTPWAQQVLGKTSKQIYDLAIRARVLGTQGVTGIVSYSSTLNTAKRALSVSIAITTQYGPATVEAFLTPTPPPPPVTGNSLDFSQDQNAIYIPAIIH